MRDSSSLCNDDWLTLIGRLTVSLGVDLDALARRTKALLRRRGILDATALLRLALAHGGGRFSHLELTDKPGGEALDRGPDVEGETGVEGEIRIADRGYSAAKALRRFIAAGQTVDDVVRLRWSSLRLSTLLCPRLFVHASWRKIGLR